MKPRSSLSLVPLSLLLLITSWPAQTEAKDLPSPWPREPSFKMDLPSPVSHVDKGHSDPRKIARGGEPVGVRKMSGDESEMFFMEYWQIDTKLGDADILSYRDRNRQIIRNRGPDLVESTALGLQNASIPHILEAPFALHTERRTMSNPLLRRLPQALSLLGERAFQCPSGTSDCSSISRPNSCCPSGETCQLITDSGQGDVGCCGQEQSCSQQVAGCQQGYSSCPGTQGGGCCIPGYVCVGVGCKCTHPFSHHEIC